MDRSAVSATTDEPVFSVSSPSPPGLLASTSADPYPWVFAAVLAAATPIVAVYAVFTLKDFGSPYVVPDDLIVDDNPLLTLIISSCFLRVVCAVVVAGVLLFVVWVKTGWAMTRNLAGVVKFVDVFLVLVFLVCFFGVGVVASKRTSARDQSMSEGWSNLPPAGAGSPSSYQSWYSCCGWANTTDRASTEECSVVNPAYPPCADVMMPYIDAWFISLTLLSWVMAGVSGWGLIRFLLRLKRDLQAKEYTPI